MFLNDLSFRCVGIQRQNHVKTYYFENATLARTHGQGLALNTSSKPRSGTDTTIVNVMPSNVKPIKNLGLRECHTCSDSWSRLGTRHKLKTKV